MWRFVPLIFVLTTAADDAPPSKSEYNLFHPTPRPLMREMSTDRPDKTESPYTVDAGHFQIEADLFAYGYDRYNSDFDRARVESVSYAPINLKAGLLNNVDLQVVLETYNEVRTRDPLTGAVTTSRGFGDVIPRLKWNLWGNDGGRTALALLPFVKIPTNEDGLGNSAVEGGMAIPLGIDLPGGWGMGLMTQFEVNQNGSGVGEHYVFVNSATISHAIISKLDGYVEFFSAVSTEGASPWVGTVDGGLTYHLTPDIQLDLGINFGLTRSADDWNPFVGISFRF
jgi:hypothetical protein